MNNAIIPSVAIIVPAIPLFYFDTSSSVIFKYSLRQHGQVGWRSKACMMQSLWKEWMHSLFGALATVSPSSMASRHISQIGSSSCFSIVRTTRAPKLRGTSWGSSIVAAACASMFNISSSSLRWLQINRSLITIAKVVMMAARIKAATRSRYRKLKQKQVPNVRTRIALDVLPSKSEANSWHVGLADIFKG